MGFLFLVLYPPPRPPARPPPHSLTHSPTHSLTHSLIQSLTQCAFCVAGVAQCALPRGRMYALASLGSPSLLRGRRGTMCTAKGSDVRPGVTWVSASFARQAWDNVHCQGVGCTPWRPLGLRFFCVAGVAQCALPRGRMYALASLGSPPLLRGRRGTMCTAKGSDVRPGVPWVSASFAWQAWDNVHCQGGWMYALASLGSPPLLRGRRGTLCTAKGSDVRPGVPWVSASFAWQAWHNVHCQGVGCTPWRPLGLRLFCVAGVAQCALPRGRMYALASLGSPPLLRGRRGTMCTAKGSDVRPGVPWVSASFAWQAWHNVHCQGGRMYALASLGSPSLLRGRRGTMCILPRGRMYALASLGSPPLLRGRRWDNVHCQGVPWMLRLFGVAGVGQSACILRGRRGTMCTAKGVGCTPWRPLGSASFAWQAWDNVHFAWQAWDNVHCQGIGCTAWSPLGSASFAWQEWDNVHFAWQAWDNVHCQGGWMYALASLGLRFFCVAGAGTHVHFAWQAVGLNVHVRHWRPLGSRTHTPLRGRRHNVHCQGVGVRLWRPLGSRTLLRGRRSLTHSLTQRSTGLDGWTG